jgi:hypothetical protein
MSGEYGIEIYNSNAQQLRIQKIRACLPKARYPGNLASA